jgi:NTE family protein
MKKGLCLAGGGVKGAAHVGVLKAFEEENIKFDYVSGTSSGSIVSCLYAVGYSADEIFKLFKKNSKRIKYVDFRNIFKFIIGSIVQRKIIINGFNSGIVLEKTIKEACEEKEIYNINQIEMPLIIPSVDLHTGALYVFSSIQKRKEFSDEYIFINNIDVGKAVRASCSYPGVFSPCEYKETELIDGGIRENVPWKLTKDAGAEKVISIVFENNIKTGCCPNIIDVVTNSIGILCHELSNYELSGADYILKLRLPDVALLDVRSIDDLYQYGYVQAKEKIWEIKEILKDKSTQKIK